MRKPTERLVMHSYPGMVAVVTARWNGRQNVMAAGWHSYISINPPLYGVAVSNERFTYHLIERSGFFGVHFLPADKSEWIQYVGVTSGATEDKFGVLGMKYEQGLTADIPILTDAYIAYECRVLDSQTYGDHDWFVGAITQFYRDDALFKKNNLPELSLLSIPLYLGRSTYAVLDADVELKSHYEGRDTG
jgi:flavin reductase (DIM6/NTAB) family NADH-FMN oxidoreductase RutF